MGVFFKTTEVGAPQPAVIREALRDAYLMHPPTEAEAETMAAKKAREVSGGPALAPQWAVFLAAAVLLAFLLVVSVYVASAADAQPKDLASSQLKTLSAALITAFPTLLGAVVGMITGEAIGKKSGA